ncbi:hypothetical protein U1Q18_032528 [Sarracenia purpurea var. burkii]
MGYLLKEVLKTLCGVNQWSYAVFWKIGCQNPKLLIWEECYYETVPCSALPRIPGIESLGMAVEEWEECWVSAQSQTPQVGLQAENKVGSLVNKMAMGNRVNIVGEGLVGRAAFTGDHLWILSQYYSSQTHPSEVQKEVCQQFSSGMQTVAVIPVLAHGVVQLGSSLAIMENTAFVNDVKSLIVHLGCVPGALLSDNYTSKVPSPRIGEPLCPEKSAHDVPSGSSKVKDFVPFAAEGCNQQSIPSQPFEFVVQPSHSLIRQIEDNLQATSSKFQCPKLSKNVVKSQNGLFCQQNTIPVIKPCLPFSSQLENGETGAEVIIPSNPELQLNQQASLYYPRSRFDEQHSVGLSSSNYSNLRVTENQILSDAILENFNGGLSTSSGFIMSQGRPNRGLSSSSQLQNGASSHPRSILYPRPFPSTNRSANHDFSCTHDTGNGLNVFRTQSPTSEWTGDLASNHLLFRSFDPGHSKDGKCYQIEVAHRKERVESDLFEALNSSSAHQDECMALSENNSGLGCDSQKHDGGKQSRSFKNAKYEDDVCIQPSSSGDDLFDILGVDFKNKIFSDDWNKSPNGGPKTNTKALSRNNYEPLSLQDSDSDLYSFNEGNSSSGIFLATGTDHLLDAVVNRVYTTKQGLDDSLSCGTTLTKISSPFVPNDSPSYRQTNVSDKRQDEFFKHPKSMEKLGPVGSCSFKSECSKEDAGNYSQTSSLYGSQISSWVDQGHSKTHNSTASAAYSKRPDDVSKLNRKRVKHGENPRPRPKDRQMIQDRMKELREIVPNGAKYSIDVLLERTIKHMLFLQSVTKHADKLKQTGESKV